MLRVQLCRAQVGRLSLASPRRKPLAATAPVVISARRYSAPAGLTKQEVEGRIMDLLKNFDKVGYCGWKGEEGMRE